MAVIPDREHSTSALIYALHAERRAAQPARAYLGASQIGGACDRALWYAFRWADALPPDGRMVRLWDSGSREELRVLAELRAVGVTVSDRDPITGEQWEMSDIGGHFGGSMDAAAHGLPEAPKTWHCIDVKTAKTKKFDELLRNGFEATYPQYLAQGQVYMGKFGLTRAMFIFVCKDDDRIFIARFEFDEDLYQLLMARAKRIIFAEDPPAGISDNPSFWQCRFCDFRDTCHGDAVLPPTCRSCAHVTPEPDGDARWSCAHHGRDVTESEQRAGCTQHRYIPILLHRSFDFESSDGDTVTYRHRATGELMRNGERPGDFESAEIYRCADKAALRSEDQGLQQWRAAGVGARVTG